MITFPTLLLRLVVALILGALVGWERESSEQNAGIRTIALVSLGTALFTIISAFGFDELLTYPHIQLDPTRIASYIVAGIGFLGGGSIFLQQDIQRVRGLTTAASIWVVAAIGMACGVGMLLEAVIVTAFVLLVLIGMRYVEAKFLPLRAKHMQVIYIGVTPDARNGELLGRIYDTFDAAHILVEGVEFHQQKGEDKKSEIFELLCRCDDNRALLAVTDTVRTLPGVLTVRLQLRKSAPPIG